MGPDGPHPRAEPTDDELDDVDDMYKNAAEKFAGEGVGKPEHDKDQSDDRDKQPRSAPAQPYEVGFFAEKRGI